MNEVRAISIFVRAATLGSLRKAAVDQGISPQAASHAVMQLEKELGVRLFHRTTRKLSLTEEGQGLLHSVEPALATLSSALDDARRSKEEIAGPLRVSAPSGARAHGAVAVYPGIRGACIRMCNWTCSSTIISPTSSAIAPTSGFRGGSPPAGGTIARRLLPIQLIVCASPAYIERHGAPQAIDDLDAHRCTGYRRANTGKQAPWEFLIGDEIVYRDIATTLCTNDTDAETEAVLAGLAIGQLGSFSAASHIRSGQLVPLLTQHVTQREAIYIYYRHRTEQPLRVRTFIDFMVARLAENKNFFLEPSDLRTTRST